MSTLNKLIHDLGNDAKLEEDYRKDPQSVMDRYNLDPEEIEALRTENLEQIRSICGLQNIHLSNGTVRSYDE